MSASPGLFIAVGVDRYDDPGWLPLARVTPGVATVSEVFTGLGYTWLLPELASGASRAATVSALEGLRAVGRDLVVLWNGHGQVAGGRHYLVTVDTPSTGLDETNAVPAALLGRLLAASGARRVLVLLDCSAGGIATTQVIVAFGEAVSAAGEAAVACLSASRGWSSSVDGRFSGVIADVVRATGNGELRFGELTQELEERLGSGRFDAAKSGEGEFTIAGRVVAPYSAGLPTLNVPLASVLTPPNPVAKPAAPVAETAVAKPAAPVAETAAPAEDPDATIWAASPGPVTFGSTPVPAAPSNEKAAAPAPKPEPAPAPIASPLPAPKAKTPSDAPAEVPIAPKPPRSSVSPVAPTIRVPRVPVPATSPPLPPTVAVPNQPPAAQAPTPVPPTVAVPKQLPATPPRSRQVLTQPPCEPLHAEDPAHVGRYRILGRLGAGGMGLVYLGQTQAAQPSPNPYVAVKVIHADVAADPEYRRRFAREITAAGRVVGRFTAAVVDADPNAAQPWFAAEYIAGPTVSKVVRRSGALGDGALHALAAGLADAVAAIEAAGLVHRDLKPDNIILAADGPKVIDFGIARTDADSLLTRAGSLIGSPGYMSPEQVEGERAETPSDVFSLGAVLAFAAQGTGPFGDGPIQNRLYRTRYDEPDLGGVPPGMVHLIARCLAKRPADRPTPRDLVAAWSVRQDELETLNNALERPELPPQAGSVAAADGQQWQPTPPPDGYQLNSRLATMASPGVAPPPQQPQFNPQAGPGPAQPQFNPQAGPGVAPGQPQPQFQQAPQYQYQQPPQFSQQQQYQPSASPFEARGWAPALPPPTTGIAPAPDQSKSGPWWHQAVAVEHLRGGVFRDAFALILGAGLLLATWIPFQKHGYPLGTMQFVWHVAIVVGVAAFLAMTLGVHRAGLAASGFVGLAMALPKVDKTSIGLSEQDPNFAVVLIIVTTILVAGAAARIGGIRRRPILGFIGVFAAYILSLAAMVAWFIHKTSGPYNTSFMDVWRSLPVTGIYLGAAAAAAGSTFLAFLVTWLLTRRKVTSPQRP